MSPKGVLFSLPCPALLRYYLPMQDDYTPAEAFSEWVHVVAVLILALPVLAFIYLRFRLLPVTQSSEELPPS